MFYAITEKYTLECVFVYNFVTLNVSLFPQLVAFLCEHVPMFVFSTE